MSKKIGIQIIIMKFAFEYHNYTSLNVKILYSLSMIKFTWKWFYLISLVCCWHKHVKMLISEIYSSNFLVATKHFIAYFLWQPLRLHSISKSISTTANTYRVKICLVSNSLKKRLHGTKIIYRKIKLFPADM